MNVSVKFVFFGCVLVLLAGCAAPDYSGSSRGSEMAQFMNEVGMVGQYVHADANLPMGNSRKTSSSSWSNQSQTNHSNCTHGGDWTSCNSSSQTKSHTTSSSSSHSSGGSFHIGFGG